MYTLGCYIKSVLGTLSLQVIFKVLVPLPLFSVWWWGRGSDFPSRIFCSSSPPTIPGRQLLSNRRIDSPPGGWTTIIEVPVPLVSSPTTIPESGVPFFRNKTCRGFGCFSSHDHRHRVRNSESNM